MTERDDWTDLMNLYEEADVSTISMAVETGRLAQRADQSMAAIYGLAALAAALACLSALGWLLEPTDPVRALLLAFVLALVLPFWVFAFRQRHARRVAEEQLLGTPVGLVRARLTLLDMEVHAWTGRIAVAYLVASVIGALVFMVAGVILSVVTLVALGGALGGCLGLFAAYGFAVRMPALRREVTELQAVLSELVESAV